MTLLVDYSKQIPPAPTIGAAGYSGALRYLSLDPAKNLTPAERDALLTAGLAIGLVWETTTGRAGAGVAAGVADARAAEAQARALGYPQGAPIFYAVDSGALTAAAVTLYFQGVMSVATFPVGVYGSASIVEGVPAPWKWQTSAWSNGVISPQAHLYQRVAPTVTNPIPGTDENVVLHPLPLWVGHTTDEEITMRVIRGADTPKVYVTDGVSKLYLENQPMVDDWLRVCSQTDVIVIGQYTCDRIPEVGLAAPVPTPAPAGTVTVDVAAIAAAVVDLAGSRLVVPPPAPPAAAA